MAMKRTIDFHLNNQRKKANLFQAIKNNLDNDSSTDEEPVNLSANLYPLSHYINDPEQLISQLFSVVRGKRLDRIIPPELKNMSFEELKTDCLIQLLCMSKKRVLAILEGKDINSSSDSDDSICNRKKQIFEAENVDEVAHKRSYKEKKIKSSKKKKVETESESEQEKSKEKEGKTLLEILELEMKAKAIRALLGPNQKETDTQIEEAIKIELIAEKTDEKSNENKNWTERYEEREDVKEVVKTSRLCTNMRRRMLLHQQKMLAERAKLKAEESDKSTTGNTIKSKLEKKLLTVYSKSDEIQSRINILEEKSNDTTEESFGKCETSVSTDDSLPKNKNIEEYVTTSSSNDHIISSNTQESTDDDSQKSTDFERVLSEYTQKNTDLELTIHEYSKKNSDLEEEINKCSKKNDDMENIMNKCAQKNSDIESTLNNYSIENSGVDETIKQQRDLDNTTEEDSKKSDSFDSLINNYSKNNVDLKAIVNEYSKRNSDIMTLMGEYSKNNIDIQSVIGDYTEGNHKLETIIDEYSHRDAKIKTMVNEYSVNNSNVEKIIDRNNRKQSLIDKCKKESVNRKPIVLDEIEEKVKIIDIICESKNLETETDFTPTEK